MLVAVFCPNSAPPSTQVLEMSFLTLGTPTGDEGYYPPYFWGAERDGDDSLWSSCILNPLRTVQGAGKCRFFVVVTPFHAFFATYMKKMVILSPGPLPHSGVPDTMVTLPSGGLTVLSVSSALQDRIFQGSGNFFPAKKKMHTPPYFGDAGHSGDIHSVQSHSFTLIFSIF